MNKLFSILVLSSCLVGKNESDDGKKNLPSHLKPFENHIGKIFKGEFANSTLEKPVYDISRWERALNGNAIRIMHSANDVEYGGESIIMWDAKKESLVSWYFTTAGFYEWYLGRWTQN